MLRLGFDNEKYLQMQSKRIKERISQFGGKLYLEFGGKLFDDYHASRVLPGFKPDSKINMLVQLKDDAEIVLVISAGDIEKNKVRGDLGITYDADVLRLIDAFRGYGLYVGSVVLTQFSGQASAVAYEKKLEGLGIRVYKHYPIEGYPANIPHIVSEDGFGKNDYIETERSLVVITAPGPGSGKMATCLSQLYHENKRGVKAGYAKFETFPIWKSYATDCEAIAIIQQICEKEKIAYQKFVNRSDMPGGSTLGSIASALLPVKTVDIGIPLLAMHSARELMGSADQQALKDLVTAYFTLAS